jgi:hypothetical protein
MQNFYIASRHCLNSTFSKPLTRAIVGSAALATGLIFTASKPTSQVGEFALKVMKDWQEKK